MVKSGNYRFIGKNSLGYKHGKIYNLEIKREVGYTDIYDRSGGTADIAITRKSWTNIFKGDGFCPYDSEGDFWTNWEKV